MIGTLVTGRYRLDDELDSDERYETYQGTDEVLNRTVVVQILKPQAGSDASRGFLAAARAAGALTHPNVAAVYEYGDHLGRPFVVTEFLSSGSLDDLLGHGPLGPAQAAAIGDQVCAALSYAHAAGVIHGRLNPRRIAFSSAGRLKVTDFAVRSSLPSDSFSAGYLAPEAASGEPDGRADLWSLGAVLYQCITGEIPGQHPERPSLFDPEVPAELDRVILRALAPDPSERFSDASQMGLALAGIARREPQVVHQPPSPKSPVTAPRPSFIRSEWRWLMGIILVLGLGAGLVYALIQIGGDRIFVFLRDDDPPAVVSTGTFDPGGGGDENDADAANIADGNVETVWSTENYSRPALGGLKEGVGIFIDLGEAVDVAGIRVISITAGWSGTLRYSDDSQNWSAPATSERISQTDEVLTTTAAHRYWMLWITELVVTQGYGKPDLPYTVAIAELSPVL